MRSGNGERVEVKGREGKEQVGEADKKESRDSESGMNGSATD